MLDPPPGCRFIHHRSWLDYFIQPVVGSNSLYFNALVPILRRQSGKGASRWPVSIYKSRIESLFDFPKPKGQMVYAWNHLVFRNSPYILDQEYIFALCGYSIDMTKRYRAFIHNELQREKLRAILCPTELSVRVVKKFFNDSVITRKLKLVHRAVRSKPAFPRNPGSNVTLLFVGTLNEPGAFEYKGGKEAVEAYRILRRIYGERVRMIVRSDVPRKLFMDYKSIEGLSIIDQVIPKETLENLFRSSDLFVFPSHITPAVVFIDAMNFALPIVTTDEHANSEFVFNGQCGVVVKKPENIPSFDDVLDGHSSEQDWEKSIRAIQWDVVESLVQAIGDLIEKPKARRELALKAKTTVDYGTYSIRNRNSLLLELFEEVRGYSEINKS